MPELKIDSKFNIHSKYNKVNIVNPYRFNSGGLPGSHEPETSALMASIGWADDATLSPHNGLTYAEVYNVLDTYFAAGKTDGWLSKKKAVYLFIGDNATTHKWNAINPQDTDTAFRMRWFNFGTHSANGWKGNGANAYGNTMLSPFNHSTLNNESATVYLRTNSSDGTQEFTSIGSYRNGLSINTSGVNYFGLQGGWTSSASAGELGLYQVSRVNATELRTKVQGNSVSVNANASQGLDNVNYTLGTKEGATLFSSKEYAYASLGEGLTDTQMVAHENAVQQLQTDLGRNV